MKQRNPIAVFFLPFVTFGIYSWYWLVKTKGEMNKLGEEIPTAWIWLIPVVGSIWWLWKYSEGVEHVTGQKISGVLAFLLLFMLGNIGQTIIQDSFNKVTGQPVNVAQPIYNQPLEQPVAQPVIQPMTEMPLHQPTETVQAPVHRQSSNHRLIKLSDSILSIRES